MKKQRSTSRGRIVRVSISTYDILNEIKSTKKYDSYEDVIHDSLKKLKRKRNVTAL